MTSTTHLSEHAREMIKKVREDIKSSIKAPMLAGTARCERHSLVKLKEHIFEIETSIGLVISKISGVEAQLPTVVHEYNKEGREKLMRRLQKLEAERDDLNAVIMSLRQDSREKSYSLNFRRRGADREDLDRSFSGSDGSEEEDISKVKAKGQQ